MDKLISAEKLIQNIRKRSYIDKALAEIFETIIEEQPADFDKEKVIKYLSIRKHVAEEDAALYDEVGDTNRAHLKDTIARCYKNAIEVVEKGGIE